MFNLDVQYKNKENSNNAIRKQGLIPAIFFHKHEDSLPIVMAYSDYAKMMQSHEPIINLSNGKMAIVKEVQRNPVTNKILHISFQGVVKGEKFHKQIPIIFINTTGNAWQKEGLILRHTLSYVLIETTPENVPDHLEVDVSELNIDTSFHVKDLVLPKGVKVLDDEDHEIAAVMYPAIVEDEPELEQKEPEVIGSDASKVDKEE